MRYGYNLGCRFGLPHDPKILFENKGVKWEQCRICGIRKRWNKGFKGRVSNKEYLEFHLRNFAQRFGATRRIYNRIYQNTKIVI